MLSHNHNMQSNWGRETHHCLRPPVSETTTQALIHFKPRFCSHSVPLMQIGSTHSWVRTACVLVWVRILPDDFLPAGNEEIPQHAAPSLALAHFLSHPLYITIASELIFYHTEHSRTGFSHSESMLAFSFLSVSLYRSKKEVPDQKDPSWMLHDANGQINHFSGDQRSFSSTDELLHFNRKPQRTQIVKEL